MNNRPISGNPADPDLYEFICLLVLMTCLCAMAVLALAFHTDVHAFLDATIFPEVKGLSLTGHPGDPDTHWRQVA